MKTKVTGIPGVTLNPVGEGNGNARLNEEKVIKIKALIADKHSHKAIAMLFGVSRSTISLINKGKLWAHV